MNRCRECGIVHLDVRLRPLGAKLEQQTGPYCPDCWIAKDPNGKPQDDPPPEDEPEPRPPSPNARTLVFESEEEGARVRVYADRAGILVETDVGALLMTDWSMWLLHNVFGSWGIPGSEGERQRMEVWYRAAMALPPGDDS